jgi:type IV secretion system protein VirB5
MRRILLASAALSGGLLLSSNAHAQIPVIDSANLTQNITTAAQEVIAVEQLKNQLQQLQQTYEMFTNPTNILNMAAGMENQAIENPMPVANSLAGLVGGQTPPTGAGETYYQQNHVYTATGSSEGATQINNNGQSIANIIGIATTNLSSIEQRLQQLPDLEADLNSATSITQVSAINGRIAAESQFVQAQQAQAANLQVIAEMQQASMQQQQTEDMQSGYDSFQAALNSAPP